MLARALRTKRAQTHVHKLRSSSKELVFQSSKIAFGFRDYNAELYNQDATLTLTLDARTDRLTRIQDYLSMNGLPPLTEDQRSDLEFQITTEEIKSTIKSLPNRKTQALTGLLKRTTQRSPRYF